MKLYHCPAKIFSDLTDPENAVMTVAEIQATSPREVFAKWCDYEGLIGYGLMLWSFVQIMEKSDEDVQQPR